MCSGVEYHDIVVSNQYNVFYILIIYIISQLEKFYKISIYKSQNYTPEDIADIVGIPAYILKTKIFTVLKSPHVNKTAQEHFEFDYHTKYLKIYSDITGYPISQLAKSLPKKLLFLVAPATFFAFLIPFK